MFKRKIYDKLLTWKNEENGKKALLIEGARRIGKSTVAQEFAKNEYESYILIDFSNCSTEVKTLFNDISDLNYFFLKLQLYYNVELIERKSLIVFDEIQLFPLARQAIKHLVQDRRYDYIETGSLISIKKNVKDILIPSEERKIAMHPMDYEEFLWAIRKEVTAEQLKSIVDMKKPLGDGVSRTLMRDFRLYMLIGGMPQAIVEYIETNNFKRVDLVKRDIINLYKEDFIKLDSTGRAAALFSAIPAQLSGNASRFQVSSVLENSRSEDLLGLIDEMNGSKTVLVAYHANDPNVGLSNNKDLNLFKIYLADTGLFTTMLFMDKDFTENIVYEKLLADKLPVNLGYLYENIVAQILVANGHDLFYYSFRNLVSKRNYEIDFILSAKNKIIPIEVKSSGYKTYKSLSLFCDKFSSRVGKKYLFYTKDYAKENDVQMIPFYYLPFMR